MKAEKITFIEKTYGDVFDATVAKHPNNDALVFPSRNLRLSWAQLQKTANELSKALIGMGVKKDDKVAMWAYNVPEWVYLMIASGKTGAVLTTVNTSYKDYELEYLLSQSDAKVLLLVDGFKDVNYVDTINKVVPELKSSKPGELNCPKLPHLKAVVYLGNKPTPSGMFNFNDVMKFASKTTDAELAERQKSLNIHEVVNMQYTSGTTGRPKGAMLTHHNIINNGYLDGYFQRFSSKDRLCIAVPFFHCFGCVIGITASVVHGVTMVVVETFDAGKVLDAVQKEKCTSLYGVPTMFIAELNHPDFDKYDLSSLRTGVMAGAICPEDAMRKAMEKMHMKEITICYGLTETSPVVTQTMPDDTFEKRTKTVGKAHPNVEIKVIDKETGEELPPNTPGELCIKGYCVMKGYYKMPEKTQSAIRNGWLYSGDLATMDKDGYFAILGRVDDMIIRGGENVYPKEIEEFLYTHPKVKDSAVVGVPSKKYGEEVAVFIQLKSGAAATEDEIRQFCLASLSRYKVPKHIRFIEQFPTTASGKIQKFKLREQAKTEFPDKSAGA